MEEFIEEQIEKNQKEHLIKRKQMEDVYRSRTYESKQRLSNLLNNSNANSDNVNIQSLVSTAASSYEKSALRWYLMIKSELLHDYNQIIG